MTVQNIATYEQWLEEARNLRDAAHEAECDFLGWLLKFETQEEIWKDDQARLCYAAVLEGEHLCDPARYGTFKECVAMLGVDAVRAMGVDGARHVVRMRNLEGRAKVVDEAITSRASRGMPLSSRRIGELAKEHDDPPDRQLRHERERSKIAELEAKNRKLKAEARQLRARIRELESELRAAKSKKKRPSKRAVQVDSN